MARKAKPFRPDRKAANIFFKDFFLSHKQATLNLTGAPQVASEDHAPKMKFQARKQTYLKERTKKSRKTGEKCVKKSSKRG